LPPTNLNQGKIHLELFIPQLATHSPRYFCPSREDHFLRHVRSSCCYHFLKQRPQPPAHSSQIPPDSISKSISILRYQSGNICTFASAKTSPANTFTSSSFPNRLGQGEILHLSHSLAHVPIEPNPLVRRRVQNNAICRPLINKTRLSVYDYLLMNWDGKLRCCKPSPLVNSTAH